LEISAPDAHRMVQAGELKLIDIHRPEDRINRAYGWKDHLWQAAFK
jgi:hypothetical protein